MSISNRLQNASLMKGTSKINIDIRGIFPFAILVGSAIIFTCISIYLEEGVFEKFLGDLQPVPVLLPVGFAGFAGLQYTARNTGIQPLDIHIGREIRYPVLAALGFGMAIIVIDLLASLPPDINIAFPASLFFYPAIGLIAELFFHVLPIALFVFIFNTFRLFPEAKKRLIAALLLTAFIEPLYQVNFMHQPAGITIIIGLHILLINLVQMWVFRRSGLYSMYLLRISYYLIWHIGWGWLRLFALH